MTERSQRIFNFSLNSKINSELKMWECLQKLPKGYGKKLFQNLLEEKFGKPSNPDFEKNMLNYLDLSSEETATKSIEVKQSKVGATAETQVKKTDILKIQTEENNKKDPLEF